MKAVVVFLLVARIIQCSVPPKETNVSKKPKVPDEEAYVLSGHQAVLPCNLSVELPGDHVKLVLWIKGDSRMPIYTFDTRGLTHGHGKHWSQEPSLKNRARFQRTNTDTAALILDNVTQDDEGIYVCRVDYITQPTRKTVVRLYVVVPPSKPRILDAGGLEVVDGGVIGPYSEGDQMRLACIVNGGRPTPNVTWWKGKELYPGLVNHPFADVTYSNLSIDYLTRQDLNVIMRCDANNNPNMPPVTTTAKLDMNLKPLSVRILGENRPLSAGKAHQLVCEVAGSRPQPYISWYINSTELRTATYSTSNGGNVSVSIIQFTPKSADNRKKLICSAGNREITNSNLEDFWIIQVKYPPETTIKLGSSLKADQIKEGDDLYFECKVNAIPQANQVYWAHNDKPLHQNVSGGVIISNQTLVLQRVTRGAAGKYSCTARNSEGNGTTSNYFLTVQYGPRCGSHRTLYGVARQEIVVITCKLDAVPPVKKFRWSFNNSAEVVDIPQSAYTVSPRGGESQASYSPMTDLDYGSLLCSGSNIIGKQSVPCLFHIIPAGKPDSVVNCSLVNQSSSSISVECEEGFDGGMEQHFQLDIYESETGHLLMTQQQNWSRFYVGDLVLKRDLTLKVYAVNSKGRSVPVVLEASIPKVPEKRTGVIVSQSKLPPMIGVVIGGICTVVILICVVIVVAVMHTKRPEHAAGDSPPDHKQQSVALRKSTDSLCPEEKNPDVIPERSDEEWVEPPVGFQTPNLVSPGSAGAAALPLPENQTEMVYREHPRSRQSGKYCPMEPAHTLSVASLLPYNSSSTLPRLRNHPTGVPPQRKTQKPSYTSYSHHTLPHKNHHESTV